MDKIIFGDNQFFGVNHMSEKTSVKQAKRFQSVDDIYNTLEYVNEIGIKTFMFTTHDKFEPVFEKIKTNPRFADFKLVPCIPYAHKYANAMVDMGMINTIRKFIPGTKFTSAFRLLNAAIFSDPVPVMKLLVDSEMKQFRGLNVEAIFLLNIVTDLLLGLGMHYMFHEFSDYTMKKYNVKSGFFTMNYVKLNEVLVKDLKLKDPIICSNINKIGFRMNPSQVSVEKKINERNCFNIAMSVLASGAVDPTTAVEYINSLRGVNSILYGASSPEHIKETKELIEGTVK